MDKYKKYRKGYRVTQNGPILIFQLGPASCWLALSTDQEHVFVTFKIKELWNGNSFLSFTHAWNKGHKKSTSILNGFIQFWLESVYMEFIRGNPVLGWENNNLKQDFPFQIL